METKPYTFRKLTASDVAPMCKVISKIGVDELSKCFESANVQKAIANANGDNAVVGLQVILGIANVIVSHIPDCENELFTLLASVTNTQVEEIKNLDFSVFVNMLVDFVQKEEFSDFFGVVSRLLKADI